MLRTCQTGVKLSSSTFPSMTHGAAPGRGQDAFSWLWTSGTCPVSPSCPTSLGLRGSGWPRGTGVGGHCPCLPCPCPAPGPGTLWGLARWMACLQRNTRSYPKEFSATSSTPPASCRSSLHLSAEALSLLNHFQILY